MIQSSTRPRQKYNTIDVLCFVHVSYLVISHPILQWLGYLYLSLVNSLWQTLGVGILLLYSIFIHIALKIVTCSLFINFSEAFSFQRSVNVKDDFAFWFLYETCIIHHIDTDSLRLTAIHIISSYSSMSIDVNYLNVFLYDFILLSVSVSCKWRCWALAYPDHCLCELDSNSVDIEAASFEFIVVI